MKDESRQPIRSNPSCFVSSAVVFFLTHPSSFILHPLEGQHPDLLAVARERFRSLGGEGLPGVSTHRTKKEVFGKTRTVVVSYNERLFVAQSRTLLREVAKRQRQLAELQAGLQ